VYQCILQRVGYVSQKLSYKNVLFVKERKSITSIQLIKVKVNVKLSVLFFNGAPRLEGTLRSRGITPRTLDLGIRWR